MKKYLINFYSLQYLQTIRMFFETKSDIETMRFSIARSYFIDNGTLQIVEIL